MKKKKQYSRLITNALEDSRLPLETENQLIRAGELSDFILARYESGKSELPKTGKKEQKFLADAFERQGKNTIWERNHYTIRLGILKYVEECGMMPTVGKIAEISKLSRTTVHKHLKDFDTAQLFGEQMQTYKMGLLCIMDLTMQMAMKGNLKAMKLYFDMMTFAGKRNPNESFVLGDREPPAPVEVDAVGPVVVADREPGQPMAG